MNGHVRRLTPIGLHVRVLLLNIRVVCSLANPLKKISLRQTRGDSISKDFVVRICNTRDARKDYWIGNPHY